MSYSKLNPGSSTKWNPYILGAIGLGVVGIAAFIYYNSSEESTEVKTSSSDDELRSLLQPKSKSSTSSPSSTQEANFDKEEFNRERIAIQQLCKEENYFDAEPRIRSLIEKLGSSDNTKLLAEVQRFSHAQILFQLERYQEALEEAVQYLAMCEVVPQLGANYIPAYTLFVGCLIRTNKVDEAEQMLYGLLGALGENGAKAARMDPYDALLLQERIREIEEAKRGQVAADDKAKNDVPNRQKKEKEQKVDKLQKENEVKIDKDEEEDLVEGKEAEDLELELNALVEQYEKTLERELNGEKAESGHEDEERSRSPKIQVIS